MASCNSSPRTVLQGEAPSAAPPPPHPLCPSPWSGHQHKVRGSTAQANLRRIISIISTVLPPQPHPANALQSQLARPPSLLSPPPLETAGITESRILSTPSDVQEGIRVDLRLRLGAPWEIERRGSPDEEDHDTVLPSSACSVIGGAMTKVTEEGGGGSSNGMAAPETAESGIVSASYDGADDRVMFNSNSSEERSSEGEWNAGGGGGVEQEKLKKARVEGGGRAEKQREGRPYSEITSHRGDASRGAEESDATQEGFVMKEDVGVGKRTGKTYGNNERDAVRRCTRRDDGYLGLLLEAVRRVSGGFFGEVEEECPRKEGYAEEGKADERAGGSERGTGWEEAAAAFDVFEVVEVEEPTLGPVVRSKRGRSQVLPSRYRDSVLEPWRKQSSSGGQHRHPQRRQARTAR